MALFIMLIGIPGSGKSKLAEILALRYQATIVSTDQLRFQFTGSEEDQSMDDVVFVSVHHQIKTLLEEGQNVIYDATNLSSTTRKKILKLAPGATLKKCYFIKIPLTSALARNAKRKRVVPEPVIRNMYQRLKLPTTREGWDQIEIVHQE